MSRLLAAGIKENEAADIAKQHQTYDESALKIDLSDRVIIIVDRGNLP